jgi:hypothetical protein
MPDVPFLPDRGREVDDRIDRKVALPPTEPRGSIVGPHEDRQPQRGAVDRSLERFAAADIEDRKGSPDFSRLHSPVGSSRHVERYCNSRSSSADAEITDLAGVRAGSDPGQRA